MKIFNKKAKFNYMLLDKYEAGLALSGAEVKAIKRGRIDLSQSHVKIINSEAYLINANIGYDDIGEISPAGSQKLLLHKKQLLSISSVVKAKKLTLIPTKVYNKGRLIKLEFALAKPKKRFEKRESLKRKDIEREIERELRGEKDNNNRI